MRRTLAGLAVVGALMWGAGEAKAQVTLSIGNGGYGYYSPYGYNTFGTTALAPLTTYYGSGYAGYAPGTYYSTGYGYGYPTYGYGGYPMNNLYRGYGYGNYYGYRNYGYRNYGYRRGFLGLGRRW